ncbi:IclR family transcriptional regulator [Sphingobium sp. EM0848]|uniref:IclR family transcriptional regulator n=1 Tax=Sphingobium sp. EM0848 TaxID=2743473 RepID=UPI00159CA901|nr:IclR family transcriptional regulator [Sphingobium sp. EM0848]
MTQDHRPLQAEGAEKPARRSGIQSIEIGFQILDALARLGRPAPLSVLAKACGMAPPQVHRYLVTMVDVGLAQQETSSGHYDLGPAALNLGLSALSRTDAFRETDAAIAAFVKSSGRTVQIAALGPLGPTIVRWHLGSPPVMTSFAVGTVLPLLHSATGRMFIGFSPESEIRHFLHKEIDRPGAPSTAQIESIRQEVRKAGFAHISGDMIPGLRATAFPIRDLQGRPVLSATLLANDAFDADDDARSLEAMAEVCRTVSHALGWRETHTASA